jgi:hypothetical protein
MWFLIFEDLIIPDNPNGPSSRHYYFHVKRNLKFFFNIYKSKLVSYTGAVLCLFRTNPGTYLVALARVMYFKRLFSVAKNGQKIRSMYKKD